MDLQTNPSQKAGTYFHVNHLILLVGVTGFEPATYTSRT
jgi:hypothetical protein